MYVIVHSRHIYVSRGALPASASRVCPACRSRQPRPAICRQSWDARVRVVCHLRGAAHQAAGEGRKVEDRAGELLQGYQRWDTNDAIKCCVWQCLTNWIGKWGGALKALFPSFNQYRLQPASLSHSSLDLSSISVHWSMHAAAYPIGQLQVEKSSVLFF